MDEDVEEEAEQRRDDEKCTQPTGPDIVGQGTVDDRAAATEQISELKYHTIRQNNQFVFESHTSLSECVSGVSTSEDRSTSLFNEQTKCYLQFTCNS